MLSFLGFGSKESKTEALGYNRGAKVNDPDPEPDLEAVDQHSSPIPASPATTAKYSESSPLKSPESNSHIHNHDSLDLNGLKLEVEDNVSAEAFKSARSEKSTRSRESRKSASKRSIEIPRVVSRVLKINMMHDA